MDQSGQSRGKLFPGLIAGILAFGIGYLLTRHMVQMGPLPVTGIDAEELTVTGWFFFNAHHVPLAESISGFGEPVTASGYDLLDLENTSDYLEFLYVVPPLILIGAGILSAATEGRTRTISSAVVNGSSIAIGYLVAVIAGIFIFSESMAALGISGTMRPDLIQSIIIAGIGYPAIFGGLGGLIYFLSQGTIQIQYDGT